jgi:acyl phosphate:glycerol-3-phosphate acyltransferase
MKTFLIVFAAYLSGSIAYGKIIGLLKNIDIQKKGSGNIGFANAVRVLGWPSGLTVLVLDIAKGLAPVIIAINLDLGVGVQMTVGMAAILGHAYPIWLNFRGGKSIATGIGVVIALDWRIALISIVAYIVAFSIWRKSHYGSLIGSWVLPFSSIMINKKLTAFCVCLALFASYTHRNYLLKDRLK